jgi:hypothetical protein
MIICFAGIRRTMLYGFYPRKQLKIKHFIFWFGKVYGSAFVEKQQIAGITSRVCTIIMPLPPENIL